MKPTLAFPELQGTMTTEIHFREEHEMFHPLEYALPIQSSR